MNLILPMRQCTPGQRSLLRSISPVVLLAGGFGGGKTLGLGLKLLQLKAANPGVPGLLLAQSWRALWSITLRRLMSFIHRSMPRGAWPVVKDKNGECFLDFGDGVPVFLRSAHDPACFDGLDVGFGLGDEARHWPRESHDVLLGRVRVKCELPQVAYTSTPAMNWLADEFNSGKKDRELIRAPTSENARNLAPNFIENLRLSYSKRLQRCVIDGEFIVLEGAVYEAFDTGKGAGWMVDYEPKQHLGRKTYLAIDPGFRRSSWLWVHEITPTSWVVFDELQLDDCSAESAVQRVNDRGWPVDEIWTDPAADQTDQTVGLDVIALLQQIKTRTRAPIRYITGPYRSIPYGVDKVRTLLGDDDGQPKRVQFAERLRRPQASRGILRAMSSYQYPEVKDQKPINDTPMKDGVHDHPCDSLRYWGVGMWLTSPLRDLDRDLKQTKAPGYRAAA